MPKGSFILKSPFLDMVTLSKIFFLKVKLKSRTLREYMKKAIDWQKSESEKIVFGFRWLGT